jgi:hypothetical protein
LTDQELIPQSVVAEFFETNATVFYLGTEVDWDDTDKELLD